MVNTGWIGGGLKQANRISLPYTRAIIDAIHDGSLTKESYDKLSIFDLNIPTKCNGVPNEILNPSRYWNNEDEYWASAKKLALLFTDNFKQYETENGNKLAKYGPKI